MADDLFLMRRKQKDQWRQREIERRKKRVNFDSSSSSQEQEKSSIQPYLTTKLQATAKVDFGRTENFNGDGDDADEGCMKQNVLNLENDNTTISGLCDKIKSKNKFIPTNNCDALISTKNCDTTNNKTVPINVGFPHTKSSPSSSVSFSQSPGFKLSNIASLHKSSEIYSSASIPEREPVGVRQLGRVPSHKRKALYGDSSSSEDDFDDDPVALFRKLKQQQLNCKENEENENETMRCSSEVDKDEPTLNASIDDIQTKEYLPVRSVENELSKGSKILNLPMGQAEPMISTSISRRAPINRDRNRDDSSSDDEDLLQEFREHYRLRAQSDVNKAENESDNHNWQRVSLAPSKTEQTTHDSPGRDNKLNFEKSESVVHTPARNPLTLMRATDELVKTLNDKNVTETKGDETLLWSDSDNSDRQPSEQTKRNRKNPTSSNDSASNTNKMKDRKRQQKGNSVDKVDNLSSKIDTVELNFNDSDEIDVNEVKPTFSNPKFGPFEFVPLILSNGVDFAKSFSVPASINRYLKKYQQDGIRFVFDKAIALKIGAILGDDMGLGKTVQIVSLLAALLEKTGTGSDAIELQRRSRHAQSKQLKLQTARENMLLQGRLPTRNALDADSDQQLCLPELCPILIVIPKSVAEDWMKTFSNWGYFAVALYDGQQRTIALESVKLGIVEIMICSMGMFARKEDFDQIISCKWKIVVIDEFHQFKNERSHLATNLRLMRDKLNCVVIGLTGTIMQNDHKEMWNLIDLAAKDFFGTWADFESKYAKPIKLARAKDANSHAIELGRWKGQELSSKLKEIYIQRKKEDVLADELPEKDERIVFCEPSELQKDLYSFILQLPDFVLLRESTGPCDCGVNQKFFLELQNLRTQEQRIRYLRENRKFIKTRGECCYQVPRLHGNSGGIHPKAVLWRQFHKGNKPCQNCPSCIFLPALDILTKLSSNASLLQLAVSPENYPIGSEAREKSDEALERAKTLIPDHLLQQFPGQSYIRQSGIMDDHFSLSGKMKVVDRLMKAIQKEQGRLLLFSQSTQVLDLIQNYIVAEGHTFLRMDGSTSRRKREEYIETFKKSSDIFVFLLSTRAMGIGLNLTAANFVIIFDVEWNPSNDAQAQDRVYRIGQEKNVTVFRLVCRGTIEELKYMRQVYKTQLKSETIVEENDMDRTTAVRFFRGVAGDKERKGELFGLVNLIKFNPDASFLTYGQKDEMSSRYGAGVHTNSSVLEVIQKEGGELENDDIAQLEGLVKSHRDIAKKPLLDSGFENEYNDESALGGESQVILDIFDRAKGEFLRDFKAHDESEDEGGFDTKDSKVNESYDPRRVEKIHELESVEELRPRRSSRRRDPLSSKLKASNLDISMTEKRVHSAQNTVIAAVRSATHQNSPSPKKNRQNLSLVGKTTDKIRQGEAGTTTFQTNDLYLPSGARRK